MPAKNDTYFRHLKAGEKDYKRSDSGGLFMLVTTMDRSYGASAIASTANGPHRRHRETRYA